MLVLVPIVGKPAPVEGRGQPPPSAVVAAVVPSGPPGALVLVPIVGKPVSVPVGLVAAPVSCCPV